jgi:hypothetical protein
MQVCLGDVALVAVLFSDTDMYLYVDFFYQLFNQIGNADFLFFGNRLVIS